MTESKCGLPPQSKSITLQARVNESEDTMETTSKLARYLAIQEAYKEVLTASGKYAEGLSQDFIYREVGGMTRCSKRTIQRALTHKPISRGQLWEEG